MNDSQHLYSKPFDIAFIYLTLALGFSFYLFAELNPSLFYLILTIDLWLLGYHHVIATYTRTSFSINDFKSNIILNSLLPVAVILGTYVLYKMLGLWAISTLYLYWQLYHYSRQSEGVYKSYLSKSKEIDQYDLTKRIQFYAPVILAFLVISLKAPTHFLFMEVKTLPIPFILNSILIATFSVLCLIQIKSIVSDYLKLRYISLSNKYLISHYIVFLMAYSFIYDLTLGWLLINVWHNLQYILFVWLFNNKRFSNTYTKKAPFLSTISQKKNLVVYFSITLILTFVFYDFFINRFAIPLAQQSFKELNLVVLTVLAYQTINFHHYIVDSQIWKLRKKQIRESLKI